MDPVILHADGTVCAHPGPPRGPGRCAGDWPVTHVRIGEATVTLDRAAEIFTRMAEAVFDAASSYVNTLARAFGTAFSTGGIRGDQADDPTGGGQLPRD